VILIKKRLGLETVVRSGKTGQFDVIVDGDKIAGRGGNWLTRSLGAGYPDLEGVVEQIEQRRSRNSPGP
jgi:hypothetical protein